MFLIDFNECIENNKAYGGMAGSKLGIIYQNEDWILKFPKTTKGMRETEISYTTSPLSEYIGLSLIHIWFFYFQFLPSLLFATFPFFNGIQ